MMVSRPELLELTPQALTALSNAGFVKRSIKELDTGNVPALSQKEDGTLCATFSDGTRTQLASGQSLREASCSCGASGMCRHRVMLVLSYQRAHSGVNAQEQQDDERWNPGQWLEELSTLPELIRRRAQQLADKGLVIALSCTPGETPAARLPMNDVRFYSRSSLGFARCDCIAGSLCEHIALAVQAFAGAQAQQPGFTHLLWHLRSHKTRASDGPFDTPDGEQCRQSIRQLSTLMWQSGISQPAVSYDAAFTRAQRAAEVMDWRWVSTALTQLRAGIDAFQQRASHYHPHRVMMQLAGLNARLDSAAFMAQLARENVAPPLPWPTIIGPGVAGETPLDHLRLVSLGMRCWQDNYRYGLRVWFSDPDTGSILHLSQSWPLAEQAQSPAWQRRLSGFQAGTLAGGQVIAQAARRNAHGGVILGSRPRTNGSVPLTPDAWRLLDAPLRQPGVAALRDYLRQRPPACVRPLNQGDNLFILPVESCLALGWDPARQTLDARVVSGDGEDNILQLSLPACASAPYAIERMATLLQQENDPIQMVSGSVSISGGTLIMEPLIMMSSTRAWVLDAQAQSVGTQTIADVSLPLSAIHALLQRAQTLLIQILHNGLRYQQKTFFREAGTLAQDLQAHGFSHLAHLFQQLSENETSTPTETLEAIAHLCERLDVTLI